MLIIALGWRATYLALAAAAVVFIIMPAQFLIHSPQDMGLLPDGDPAPEEGEEKDRQAADRTIVNTVWTGTDWTLRNGIKQYRFWTLFFTLFSIGIGYGIVMTHQVALMVDIGFTAMFASMMLLLYGLFCMAGRFCGFLSDILGREATYTLGCAGVTASYGMIILARGPSDAWMLYVYAICFGFFSGINSPTYAAAVADIFIGNHFGAILGFINVGFGFGNSIGAWLGGYLFDLTGSYDVAVIASMVMVAAACTFLWMSSPRKIRISGAKVRPNQRPAP
jgi:MFS family permease